MVKISCGHNQDKDDEVEMDAHEIVEEAQMNVGTKSTAIRMLGTRTKKRQPDHPGGLMWLGPQGEYRVARPAEHSLVQSRPGQCQFRRR